MTSKRDSFVSVAMVTSNHAQLIVPLLHNLHAYLATHFVDFEIVIVDQRSRDDTARLIENTLGELTSIRLLVLACPVAYDVAMAAALENAIGDFVIAFNPGRDPISCILPMVGLCKNGADIVVGVSPTGSTIGYRVIRPFVDRILKSIGYTLPKNATHLRCISRRTVNALTQAGKFHHRLFVRMAKTGYPSTIFEYETIADQENRTLPSGIKEVLRLLVFNSTKPLRWMSASGIAMGILVLISAFYSITIKLVTDADIDITSWLLLFIAIMLITLFVMLGFFGEYLGRLLDDRGEQFDYFVVYEKNSSVMVDENRLNVLQNSDLSPTT